MGSTIGRTLLVTICWTVAVLYGHRGMCRDSLQRLEPVSSGYESSRIVRIWRKPESYGIGVEVFGGSCCSVQRKSLQVLQ